MYSRLMELVQRGIGELLNPTTDEQWQANDKTRAPGAQAGGFWRSCRQRRKDLWAVAR
jgi:hypothetical protein